MLFRSIPPRTSAPFRGDLQKPPSFLIEEEFGVEKPDQRIFLHALDRLHISAHEAWMIGDDLARDIAGSQQVGIFAIWCDLARQGLPNTNTVHPDWVIYDLSEVLDMLIL